MGVGTAAGFWMLGLLAVSAFLQVYATSPEGVVARFETHLENFRQQGSILGSSGARQAEVLRASNLARVSRAAARVLFDNPTLGTITANELGIRGLSVLPNNLSISTNGAGGGIVIATDATDTQSVAHMVSGMVGHSVAGVSIGTAVIGPTDEVVGLPPGISVPGAGALVIVFGERG